MGTRIARRRPVPTMHAFSYPIAFGHWHVHRDELVCRLPRKTVAVQAPGDLLREVLKLCDGRLAWKQVAAELAKQWSRSSVEAFLSHLSIEGALVEASQTLAHWTELGQVPGLYPRIAKADELPGLHRVAQARLLAGNAAKGAELPPLGQALAEMLRQRESHRTFADAPLTIAALHGVLWAAHGVARPAGDDDLRWHRTVASGGNMHSARWFVFVLRPLPATDAHSDETEAGVYEARFHVDGGASLHPIDGDVSEAWRVVQDPRLLRFASALVLPVWEVAVPARKYGNRATLFASLEAGQCLQNAQLMATALDAACIVRGDTSADAVLDVLRPHIAAEGAGQSHWLPMPSLVLGARPSAAEMALQQQDGQIKVGPSSRLPQATGSARLQPAGNFSFFAGPIQVGQSSIYANGRAADPRMALVKAEAEAWERRGWATLSAVAKGKFEDIKGAIDPTTLAAYTPEQYEARDFPLQPFSVRRKYLWCEGVQVETGRLARLPAECVHAHSALPRSYREKACTNSSTSGVAAWTDAEGALCRATLELIERDAFVHQWISRKSPPLVLPGSLPARAQRRVEALQATGHRIALAQIGELVPVYAVFLQHLTRPFTAITAAAHFDEEAAVDKALDEAEGRAAHAAAFPAEPIARAADVQSTVDVNRFYQTRQFFRNADFFAAGAVSEHFGASARAGCGDWATLKATLAQQGLNLIAFDITPQGAALDQGRTPLRVVRALVPGLLPIWFQHGLQPAALPAFVAAQSSPSRRVRGQSVFVHPFT
jgi:ribosomal protein S12 methylthiotransferase accessory factor